MTRILRQLPIKPPKLPILFWHYEFTMPLIIAILGAYLLPWAISPNLTVGEFVARNADKLLGPWFWTSFYWFFRALCLATTPGCLLLVGLIYREKLPEVIRDRQFEGQLKAIEARTKAQRAARRQRPGSS